VIFRQTKLPGVYLLDVEPHEDQRGFFARTWCAREAAGQGITRPFVQTSVSFNRRRGTLRGMHYQAEPHPEAKLVSVVRGAIYDVALDLRPGSPCYLQWVAVELSAENRRALYIPEGCAHGFQTLADDTEVLYQINEFYHPELSRTVRWDDPAFGIKWPDGPRILNERDAGAPMTRLLR
jgi:dTDP-4-dehydrorhamnose 3,5-epimerase